MVYDVIIAGGSYAGLSAGLQLARARRKVLVIDSAERRNRFAGDSHGFLGQDGQPAADIAHNARAQLLVYPTVEWVNARATEAHRHDGLFVLKTESGESYSARRILVATGVVDELPAIEGLAPRWGKSVFHCPYCHGYELNGGAIGVLATSALSLHQALLLPDWGPTTFFTNGVFEPDADQRLQLERREVTLEPGLISHLTGDRADVVLADGRLIAIDGLFTICRTHMASPLAEQLGCEFEEGPVGNFIKIDGMSETTVAGVFACGDTALPFSSVAVVVGHGAKAGSAVHQSLVFR